MNKKEAINVWREYQVKMNNVYKALDSLNSFMGTDKYRMMSDTFGENEEHYAHRKNFQEFLDEFSY